MTRVIAGSARGRRLRVPSTGTRPTTDRVRESLFSSLESILRGEERAWSDVRVLDLYAGSGALGLEALSRGAESVTLVERSRDAVRVLQGNVRVVGLPGATVLAVPVARLADRPATAASLVFADPPYDVLASRVAHELEALCHAGWIDDEAVIIVERSSGDDGVPMPPTWDVTSQRRYGDTVLWYGRARRTHGGEEPHA